MLRERNLNFGSVRNERRGRLQPKERFLGQRLARFTRVIRIIQTDGDELRGRHRRQGFQALEGDGLFVKRRRPKNVAAQAEEFSVHDLGIKYFVAFLEAAYGSHKLAITIIKPPHAGQGESEECYNSVSGFSSK